MKKAIKELLLEQNENQQKEESEHHDVFDVPCITGFSELLVRDLKQLKIGVTFQKRKYLIQFCLQTQTSKTSRWPDEYYLLHRMQIMQSTLCRWNATVLSSSQIQTPICHQMQSTNQWNCTTYPQKQETWNWLGKQSIPRFWIALEEEENQRSPVYRLPESKYKHITKWTDEFCKRNWDFQLLERVQPTSQENIFQENSNQEPNRKNSRWIMNILNEITNLLPARKGLLFDENT